MPPPPARSAPNSPARSLPPANRARPAGRGPCSCVAATAVRRSAAPQGRRRRGDGPSRHLRRRGSPAAGRCRRARQVPRESDLVLGEVDRPGQRRRARDHLLAPHQGLQPPAIIGVEAHHVGVDTQGEFGVGVADLGHHRDRVLPERDQDRSEGMAQLVGGEAPGQRHLAAALQQLVGPLEGWPEDAGAQVVGVPASASQGREDEGVGIAAIDDRLVGGEDVAQDRQDLDLAQPGLRL